MTREWAVLLVFCFYFAKASLEKQSTDSLLVFRELQLLSASEINDGKNTPSYFFNLYT